MSADGRRASVACESQRVSMGKRSHGCGNLYAPRAGTPRKTVEISVEPPAVVLASKLPRDEAQTSAGK